MPTPRALRAVVLAGLAMAGLIASSACSSGPAPQAWAVSVCEALAPWRAEITSLATRTQQQMTAGTTPAQAKENLVRLLTGAEAASETARGAVARAGVPDATNGEEVAKGFVASLAATRDAYGKAADDIEALEPGEPDPFYDAVSAVLATLTDEFARNSVDTTVLDSPELQEAFAEVPECH